MQSTEIDRINKFLPVSEKKPDNNFYDFINNYKDIIKDIIISNKSKNKILKNYNMRIGFVYPLNSVIDDKIKDLCCLKYYRKDGRYEPCGGITYKRKACPPYSPKVSDTIELLKQSSVFLIMQFEKIEDTIIQKHIHNFTVSIEKLLIKNNFNVLKSYCCGPCRVCAEGCTADEECRHPDIRRFALESCGFSVNTLCQKASEHTIYGSNDWQITWIKDWGLDSQTPLTFKSMTGILLK